MGTGSVMTNPLHAYDRPGKGRYYTRCGRDGCPIGDSHLISVTNALDMIAKPSLIPAAAKETARAAWQALPLMVATSRQEPEGPCSRLRVAERCGNCRFCITSAIKREHKAAWEAKAELGTRIHAHAHAHVTGRPIPPDPEVAPFIAQYLQFLTDWQVDPARHVEASETTVLSRRHEYAGTGDVWLHLPGFGARGRRGLVLVDIKTSLTKPATAIYPEQELQLAGLRYAESAVLVDDTEVKVPRFAAAAILNLRQTSHALIPLPADKAAHAAFLGTVVAQRHFHVRDTKAWVRIDAPAATPTTSPRKAS